MANSLRAKLSKLRHDGHITNIEYQEFLKKIDGHDREIRNKAIDEFAEKLKYELNGNIIPDNEKFTYARKQQEQICHQNMTLKRAIKYVDYFAEQLKR